MSRDDGGEVGKEEGELGVGMEEEGCEVRENKVLKYKQRMIPRENPTRKKRKWKTCLS